MRYVLIILLSLLGCSHTRLQHPPNTEPTLIEQKIAQPLNYCQRGKYYTLIKYRHDMLFYLNSDDKDVALQAAKNLQTVNLMIDQMTVLGMERANNKRCFK
jgi:hypothetical protein